MNSQITIRKHMKKHDPMSPQIRQREKSERDFKISIFNFFQEIEEGLALPK